MIRRFAIAAAAALLLVSKSPLSEAAPAPVEERSPTTRPTTRLVLKGRLPGPCYLGVQRTDDGKRILTASGRQLRVWDAATYEPITPALDHGDQLLSAAFDAKGDHVLSVSTEYARVWDVATGKPASPKLRHARNATIVSASISPDGKRVMTVAAPPPNPNPVRGIVINPVNAPMPKTREEFRTVRVWDRVTGELELSLDHPSFVNFAAFSPDGKLILTVCASLSGAAYLWDASVGALVTEPFNAISGWPAGAFSRDGKCFAVAGFYEVNVCSTETHKLIRRITDFGGHDLPTAVALSPDGGTLLATSQSGDLHMWDVQTGERKGKLYDRVDITPSGITFSPDGREFLVTEDEAQRPGILSADTTEQRWVPGWFTGKVRGGWFAADGTPWIACSDRSGTAIYKLER